MSDLMNQRRTGGREFERVRFRVGAHRVRRLSAIRVYCALAVDQNSS